MKKKDSNNKDIKSDNEHDKYGTPSYPYPERDDIYKKSKEETDIDPEDISELKKGRRKGKYWENDESSLDVPGAELDDEDEKNGNEDEENNYYSLGGDEHNDLEEDKGE
jgi:hypothetical protein